MAGYFIDLLKCLYPKSTVTYFFCRSHQAGLTKAHDIIRTLAYHCMENDRSARSVLEALKHKDFRISKNLGVAFLFEKLLLEPLRGTTKEIYIILDGLDEADVSHDESDPSAVMPDLHILLKCLSKLPSTRLLFISRPSANVSSIVQNTTTITITKAENERDINAYVNKAVAESERLRTHFKNEHTNPVTYFQEKADGIFLWVVLVINQLAKAKTKLIFQKYLKGFSDASGSMNRLYESILLRCDQDDVPWIKEIIRWLAVAERQLSVEELKDAVEWCLKDEHVDFQNFLEVECGSILQVLSVEGKVTNVQLIHETFRSFVLNPIACPQEFLINEADTHGHLTLNCLQRLSSVEDSTIDNEYCLTQWVAHLSKATSAQQAEYLLVSLHQFFESDGVKQWITHGLCEQPSLGDGLQTSIEEQDLQYIGEWLQKCQVADEGNKNIDERRDVSVAWRMAILSDPSILGESIGKAAATIWLYESFDRIDAVRLCFLLGLKYYWKRKNRSQSNLNELNELATTDFKDISRWSGNNEHRQSVNKNNIGVALFSVLKWDDCIRCLDQEGDLSDDYSEFNWYLGVAFMAKHDYARAIKAFKFALDRLVFKDGHRQSFTMAELARIDLKAPGLVVYKDGHQEKVPAADILRIEFENPAVTAAMPGRGHFVGKWEVGEGNGGRFFITLEADGEARKTLGSPHGTWTFVDGEARISWDDGWHDAIRKVGTKHEKEAYEPGKSFDDKPSNVTPARNTQPKPI